MDKFLIDQLRSEVEKTYGRKILSSADCQQICIEIHQKTKLRVSFNTLRRFFNLMKDMHLASNYTCDVLSQYCGFPSFADFEKYKSEKRSGDSSMDKRHGDNNLLNFLIHLFHNTEATGVNDITYFSLVKQTICYLDRYPEIVDAFQRSISKTKNGQGYYFEQFINIDQLNGYYGTGLRYYLCEKKTGDAQVTGQGLQCFRYWMSMENEQLKKQWEQLQVFSDQTSGSAAVARFFASQLYYQDLIGLQNESPLMQARRYYITMPATRYTYSSYYCFENILAEALLLTGYYEEAMFYLNELVEKIKVFIPSYIDIALLETIYLFKAICYTQTNKKAKAREMYEKINPANFYFLSKKYLTILYLGLSKNMRSRHPEGEQIKQLIRETGFIGLENFWESCDSAKNTYS
jgi:tetratricopeptide (TPR) repeat protein